MGALEFCAMVTLSFTHSYHSDFDLKFESWTYWKFVTEILIFSVSSYLFGLELLMVVTQFELVTCG